MRGSAAPTTTSSRCPYLELSRHAKETLWEQFGSLWEQDGEDAEHQAERARRLSRVRRHADDMSLRRLGRFAELGVVSRGDEREVQREEAGDEERDDEDVRDEHPREEH